MFQVVLIDIGAVVIAHPMSYSQIILTRRTAFSILPTDESKFLSINLSVNKHFLIGEI
ncbi:hypothetical protein ASZ90_007601 [hydrocarbon metagenome]|uniref:Uncharacterized protein n=1 Tax=hydrocarbon metagenome TaxID=938273 RepID=A0A0W8FQL9_9ZZZZ